MSFYMHSEGRRKVIYLRFLATFNITFAEWYLEKTTFPNWLSLLEEDINILQVLSFKGNIIPFVKENSVGDYDKRCFKAVALQKKKYNFWHPMEQHAT